VLGLTGCLGPTKYADEGWTGGYKQTQLEPGIWRVSFFGNGFTTAETVQTFWLYRCAEVALENGADGFEVVSDIHLVSLKSAPAGRPQLIPVHGGGGGGFVYVPMYVPDTPKPSLEADIKLVKGPFKADPPRVFDAAALKAVLEPIVKGKLCDGNVCPHAHHYLKPQSA
jgi:hypothetical protein